MCVFQFLESFFLWLFHSLEFWSALFGVVGALVGAVVGGRIAGRYALKAQMQAAEDQRKQVVESENRALKHLLKAIAVELSVLKSDNFDSLEQQLQQRAETRRQAGQLNYKRLPPLAMTLTEQNRFTVYESNADKLGMIADEDLLVQIVRVYGLAKGLIDNLNANSRNFEHWREITEESTEEQLVADMLTGLEQGIHNGLQVLQCELTALLKKLASI
jgi:hypothetical protein